MMQMFHFAGKKGGHLLPNRSYISFNHNNTFWLLRSLWSKNIGMWANILNPLMGAGGRGRTPGFSAFANFCGENIPTMTHFKPLIWHQWTQSWEGILIICSHKPLEPEASTPVDSCLPKWPANLLPREFFSLSYVEATWISISCKRKLRTQAEAVGLASD